MKVLRITTNCFRCNKEVDKLSAREVIGVNKDKRYECFNCFKRNKREPWWDGGKIPVKKNHYCERCRYKFISKKSVCPYCNSSDMVTTGSVTVKDLL